MTRLQIYILRAFGFACFLLAATSLVLAQRFNVLPVVDISTDASSYMRFEPITVTTTVTNESSNYQEYGPVGFRNWGVDTYLLITPSGDSVGFHGLYFTEVLPPIVLSTYAPGEYRQASFNLNIAYDVWSELGTYTLGVVVWTGGESYVSVASTQFEVVAATAIRTTLADTLAEAARLTFNEEAWDPFSPDVEAMILEVKGTRAWGFIIEFASYLHALFAELDSRENLRSDVDSLYTAFLARYPSSPYALAAKQRLGGLILYGGSPPTFNQEDPKPFSLSLRVFLEGAFSAGAMTSRLGSAIPTKHPYDSGVWSSALYDSTSFIDDAFVDWIYVSLADTGATPDTVVADAVGFVLESGWVQLDILRQRLPPGLYHVVVDHRNHIAVMSDKAVDMTGLHAEHDFTTGHAFGFGKPQQLKIVGEDSIYVMWAGDGNCDGQVTAPDFNLWNAATTAGATGYEASDYSMDAQVTAPDFNLWNANTTAGAATGISDELADLLLPRGDCSSQTQAIQSLTSGPGSYIRLVVTKDTGQDFWLDVEARADSSTLPANTLASAVIDVFYDDTELTPASADRGVLQSGAYLNSVQQLAKDGNRFIRISYRASSTGSPWHDLDTDWEVIHKLYFDRSPPKHDDGTSIRARTVTIGFYDSHANSNGSKRVNETIPEIQ